MTLEQVLQYCFERTLIQIYRLRRDGIYANADLKATYTVRDALVRADIEQKVSAITVENDFLQIYVM